MKSFAPIEPTTPSEKWIPKPHQREQVKWLLKHPEAAIFAEPGLGKTTSWLEAFRLMQRTGAVHRALIIAPLRVCYLVWSHENDGELAKWTNFHDLRVALLHGDDKAEAARASADLYVINPDGLEWLVESGTLENLLEQGVDTLCIDELSAFKHTQTRRFKLLENFLPRFRRRAGLTGSPSANGLLDLFGQAKILDLGRSLGPYITRFRYAYFMPTGYGGYTWVPKEGAHEAIYQAMSELALSQKATDHLDLPDLVEQNLWVNLPPKVQKVYDDLEDELIAQIEEETVTAANAAVASMKCRQVASGGLYLDTLDELADGTIEQVRETRHLHHAKTEALLELIAELQGSPLLVAYEFQHDLARIRSALGDDVPVIGGGISPKRSAVIAQAWNRGELPVLVGHPQAMGHGLNLQAAGHHVCWYSLTWNFELYDQLIRRIWRQGNNHQRVFVHRLLARRTVDQVVLAAITRKRRGQVALFDALRDLAASRARRRRSA